MTSESSSDTQRRPLTIFILSQAPPTGTHVFFLPARADCSGPSQPSHPGWAYLSVWDQIGSSPGMKLGPTQQPRLRAVIQAPASPTGCSRGWIRSVFLWDTHLSMIRLWKPSPFRVPPTHFAKDGARYQFSFINLIFKKYRGGTEQEKGTFLLAFSLSLFCLPPHFLVMCYPVYPAIMHLVEQCWTNGALGMVLPRSPSYVG